jgi:glycosyltransferase involved in cell wall biosynthesis
MANSDVVKEYLVRHEEVAPEKITVIPNGLEDQHDAWPRISRAELGLSDNDFVLIAVERLRKNKNTAYLIEKMGELAPKLPQLKLLVVGYGPMKPELMSRVHKLGIAERCKFLGYQEYPYCFMRLSDVFVSSSLFEGMSNALLEATMMGLPVIVHEAASAGVVRDGQTGFSFPMTDKSECGFGDYVARLYHDRDAAKRLGAAGRAEYLSKYTMDRQVQRYISYYEGMKPVAH